MTDGGFDWVLRHSPPRSFLALLLSLPCRPPRSLKIVLLYGGRTSSGILTMWIFGMFTTGGSSIPRPPATASCRGRATRPTGPGGQYGWIGEEGALRDVVAFFFFSRPGRLPLDPSKRRTYTWANTRLTRRRGGLGLGRSYALFGVARDTVDVYAEHALVFVNLESLGLFTSLGGCLPADVG
ncbi:hypothetical protein F5883DRAFT_534035 [Diaporthe sp. PMI_573]|nr:hypothetical protein F5883DRAFT_534035 [Diaporthaceae sp. PMI_573]